jgi:hypothetical protein
MTNDIRDRLMDTARTIETHLPPGTGFILLAFDFGPRGDRMEYVSNAERTTALMAMREYLDNCERAPQSWGKHCSEPPDLTT